MKRQITLNGYVYASKPEKYELNQESVIDGIKYTFTLFDKLSGPYKFVAQQEITFEVDDVLKEDFIKNIEEEKVILTQNYNDRMDQLNKELQQITD